MCLTGDGAILSGSTFLGGTGLEDGYAAIVQPDGRAVVAGLTESADFPATPGAFDEVLDGTADAALFAMDLRALTVAVSDTPATSALIAAIQPNPCNPFTTIAFTLPVAGATQLTIHDLRGRRVATLADGVLPAGAQTRRWDGRDAEGREVSAGVYLCRLASPSGIASRPVTIVR